MGTAVDWDSAWALAVETAASGVVVSLMTVDGGAVVEAPVPAGAGVTVVAALVEVEEALTVLEVRAIVEEVDAAEEDEEVTAVVLEVTEVEVDVEAVAVA